MVGEKIRKRLKKKIRRRGGKTEKVEVNKERGADKERETHKEVGNREGKSIGG